VANHRLRRWLQFGILDLLILTAVVAVVLLLFRPMPQGNATRAMPWIVGEWWEDGQVMLSLFPDGTYSYTTRTLNDFGTGWKLTRGAEAGGTFVLLCGERRFAIRSEWGSGVMELLNVDGTVSRLELFRKLEGPMRDNAPHGTWIMDSPNAAKRRQLVLEYRNGELVDLKVNDKMLSNSRRLLHQLNELRVLRGLAELTERDFPGENKPEEERTP
jgi:hypothetical protein